MLYSKLYVNLVLTNKMNIEDVPESVRQDVRDRVLQIDSNFFDINNEESILNEEDVKNITNNNKKDSGNE